MQRKIKLSCLVSAVCCLFVFPGCSSEDINETKEYLRDQKDELVKNAQETYDRLHRNTNQLIADMKESGSEAWHNTNAELNEKMIAVNQELNDLKKSGKETLHKTNDAFNRAAGDLEDYYNKTKAKFEKSKQEPNQP
jgi:hypothetical protein